VGVTESKLPCIQKVIPVVLSSMKYISTRGGSLQTSFEGATLEGLANDGGLYIPEHIPALPPHWRDWEKFSFQQLACEIFRLYIDPCEIVKNDLEELVTRSYSTFRVPEITPLKLLKDKDNLYLLELFHGPTFAFKDVALQFVGNLFEYFIQRKNRALEHGQPRHHMTVVGATSGDTGSAAIYGLRNKQDISVFILHPKGRVSPIQEAQMTTVLDKNIHNIAVGGTFDDCQDLVKSLFADTAFNAKYRLGAVNSINWARILAQITYYFHAYFSLSRGKGRDIRVKFVVPTGNFGDILAGYFAKRMGLPIEQLVIATNENDILDRFWRSGSYQRKPVSPSEAAGGIVEDGVKAHEEGAKETLSPAMDILVSSNFERLLWYLVYECEANDSHEQAGKIMKEWMTTVKTRGSLTVPPAVLQAARRDFCSECISDKDTLATIRDNFMPKTNGEQYILDPHTAVGVSAATRLISKANTGNEAAPTFYISLATAHPAKFSNAVDLALTGKPGYSFEQVVPVEFEGLLDKEKRIIDLREPNLVMIKDAIIETLSGGRV